MRLHITSTDALSHAVSSETKLKASVRFENQPIPFMQNFLYQLHKHTRSNGAILGKSDHEKMAISMLDFANKMPSYCEKDMKLVIDAEHRLLLFIAIYERQKAMSATPLFQISYYPPKFASTSLILIAIITYRHKKQSFLLSRINSKEQIKKRLVRHRIRILSF